MPRHGLPPLRACGERSIGGLWPPFLIFKNADVKRRLCEARRGALLTQLAQLEVHFSDFA